jgi:ribosome-binding protein aMBF1 (putative translation factor)
VSNPLKRVMIPRMLRWLAIAALVFSVPAQAQVFKPGKSSSSSTKKSSAKKSSAKKSSHKTGARKKKSAHKDDDEPKVDPDYVKIIDDDDD